MGNGEGGSGSVDEEVRVHAGVEWKEGVGVRLVCMERGGGGWICVGLFKAQILFKYCRTLDLCSVINSKK